jgi:dihydrolipoamide dehydrogenase
MPDNLYDIVVIGGGPGGYTAAVRAAQLGFKTAVVERDRLGGICLNWGCIPSKSLLRTAELMHLIKRSGEFGIICDNVRFDFGNIIKRSRDVADKSEKGVQYLMKKNKINYINGTGKISATDKDRWVEIYKDGKKVDELNASHIIIATGARAKNFPGVDFDGKKIISYMEALALDKLPETMTIIGAGAVGVEFAYFFNAFGTKVTLIEMLDQLLPNEDKEISDVLAREFRKLGINSVLGSKVEQIKNEKASVKVKVSGKSNDTFESSVVLVAISFQGNIENMGIGPDGLAVNTEKGFVKVDTDYKTNVEGIYAIGDVTGPPMLAHVASAEGINCIEKIKGLEVPGLDRSSIPAVTFCQPQVASVGLTEKQALETGHDIKVGKFPFSAGGKSRAIGETSGLVKVIFDKQYDELLGAHIIGSEASELIAELTLAKSLESTHEQIIRTVHSHPTLSEAVAEAVADAYGEAINI